MMPICSPFAPMTRTLLAVISSFRRARFVDEIRQSSGLDIGLRRPARHPLRRGAPDRGRRTDP
jgi:hypothetical protein